LWQARLLEYLDTVLATNAHLSAPMVSAALDWMSTSAFRRAFELIPDMTAEVNRWSATSMAF
jgi:hypothetical protein